MSGEGTIEQVLSGSARWCVIEGDNRALLRAVPDGAVHHVITDPPYSKLVHTAARSTRFADTDISPCRAIRDHEIDFEYLSPALRRHFARESARVAQRWVIAFSDFECVHWLRLALVAAGMRHFRIGVWDKLETGSPQFNGCGPGNWGEALEIAHSAQAMRWNSGGARGVWRHINAIARGGSGRTPKTQGGGDERHRTEKPLPLMLELIEDFTDADDIVLDPFCGGGTTLVAALRLGRRAIGMEMNPKWVRLSRDRLRAEEQGLSIRAARSGQQPLFGAK